MKAINDIKKWEAEGTLREHTVPLSEVMEVFTQEELDSIPEPEVDELGNLVFKEPPKLKAFNEDTGKEVEP